MSETKAPTANAVLDTNVYLDIHSCHDFRKALQLASAEDVTDVYDHRAVVFRRVRARESLLLAFHLNAISAVTYSLGDEVLKQLAENVRPDQQSLERDHTAVFLHFVKSRLLQRWTTGGWSPAAGPAPTGSAADRWLIERAKEHGLPLITHEGFTQNGYAQEGGKIAKWARDRGVQTMFPSEFYAGKMDVHGQIENFLRQYVEHADAYLEENPGERDAVERTLGTFRHILRGEIPGCPPARVSLS